MNYIDLKDVKVGDRLIIPIFSKFREIEILSEVKKAKSPNIWVYSDNKWYKDFGYSSVKVKSKILNKSKRRIYLPLDTSKESIEVIEYINLNYKQLIKLCN